MQVDRKIGVGPVMNKESDLDNKSEAVLALSSRQTGDLTLEFGLWTKVCVGFARWQLILTVLSLWWNSLSEDRIN